MVEERKTGRPTVKAEEFSIHGLISVGIHQVLSFVEARFAEFFIIFNYKPSTVPRRGSLYV
jgi:hypothetical protein